MQDIQMGKIGRGTPNIEHGTPTVEDIDLRSKMNLVVCRGVNVTQM
jgi:hypothetical protein